MLFKWVTDSEKDVSAQGPHRARERKGFTHSSYADEKVHTGVNPPGAAARGPTEARTQRQGQVRAARPADAVWRLARGQLAGRVGVAPCCMGCGRSGFLFPEPPALVLGLAPS